MYQYNEDGTAIYDGRRWIAVDPTNRHYQELVDRKENIQPYEAPPEEAHVPTKAERLLQLLVDRGVLSPADLDSL